MYKITYIHKDETTENVLYQPGDREYCLSAGTLNLGAGTSGELSICIPQTNPATDDFACLTDEVIAYRDDKEIWRGRAMTRQYDFYLTGTLTCEGVLSYLYDTYFPPFEFQGSLTAFLEMVLENHNSQVEDRKKIYLGNVTVKDNNDYINRSSIYYDRTLTVLTEKLINDSLGGYFRIRIEDGVKYLDYLESYGTTATQAVEFGSNLLDIAQNVEYSDLATVILPIGAKLEDDDGNETDEYLTIESVNDGSIYYADEAAVEEYGWIAVSVEWEDVTEASNLLTKAKNYLTQVTSAVASFDVNAVDLALLSDAYEAFNIGDYILIQSEPHGVNQYVELTEMNIDLLDPSNDTLIFGSDTASLVGSQKTSERAVQTALESLSVRFTNLVATVITVDYLNANYITADEISANYITADDLEATIATFGYVTADEIEATVATFGYLTAEEASITYLTAESATITELTADVANINNILAGNVGSGTVQTVHLTADNSVIDEAVITEALINNATVGSLLAGTIYTSFVTIRTSEDSNGIYIADDLIAMYDENDVMRLQAGSTDSLTGESNGYNFAIWDANKNELFNATGVTATGIPSETIVDAHVASNAAISGEKLNIKSVAQCLNDDGSITVDYANVIVDETTLDYALTSVTSTAQAAQAAADEAQLTANQALSDAATAKSAADEAAADAAAAQTAADEAATNATNAQVAADEAAAAAQEAQDEYNALASRADTTEEELAAAQEKLTAAQEAADAAQTAADEAAADATAAQETANTAAANAIAAKEAADTAQSTAEAAQEAADAAQDAVDAVESRTTVLETELEVVQGYIKLIVSETDIAELQNGDTTLYQLYSSLNLTVDGITGTVSELETKVGDNYEELTSSISELSLTADEISLSVSTVESRIDNLTIGTRNYLLNSGGYTEDSDTSCIFSTSDDFDTYYTVTACDGYMHIECIKTASSSLYPALYLSDDFDSDEDYILSICVKTSKTSNLYVVLRYASGTHSIGTISPSAADEWATYYFNVTGASSSVDWLGVAFQTTQYKTSGNYIDLAWMKLEKGTVATDWTPAPEDASNAISSVKESYATLTVNVDAITSEVGTLQTTVDDNYTTLTQQISEIEQTASSISLSVSSVESILWENMIVDGTFDGYTTFGSSYSWYRPSSTYITVSEYSDKACIAFTRGGSSYYIRQTVNAPAGTYTIKMKIACGSDYAPVIRVKLGTSSTGTYAYLCSDGDLTTDWVTYSATVTVSSTSTYLYIYCYSATGTTTATTTEAYITDIVMYNVSEITNATSASLVLCIDTDDSGNAVGVLSGNADYIYFAAGDIVIESDDFALTADGSATFGGIVSVTGTVNGADGDENVSVTIKDGALSGVLYDSMNKVSVKWWIETGAANGLRFSGWADGNAEYGYNCTVPGTITTSDDVVAKGSFSTTSGDIHTSTGNVTGYNIYSVGGNIYVQNDQRLYFYDSDGVARTGMYLSVDNYYYVAVGSVTNNTYIGSSTYTTSLYLRAASYVYSTKSVTVSSDERLKTDFGDIAVYDDVFDSLQPLTYRWKTGGKQNMGFTYQDTVAALEAAGIDPEDCSIVNTYEDEESGETYGGIAYTEIIALLVHEVQAIKNSNLVLIGDRVSALEAQLDAAYLEIAELKNKLQAVA